VGSGEDGMHPHLLVFIPTCEIPYLKSDRATAKNLNAAVTYIFYFQHSCNTYETCNNKKNLLMDVTRSFSASCINMKRTVADVINQTSYNIDKTYSELSLYTTSLESNRNTPSEHVIVSSITISRTSSSRRSLRSNSSVNVV